MKPKFQKWWPYILFLVVSSGIGGLYWGFQKSTLAGLILVREDLHKLESLNYKINQESIRVRLKNLSDYDQISDLSRLAQNLIEKLLKHSKNSEVSHIEVSKYLLEAIKSYDRKLQAIEAFKAHNSIVRNSIAYLPTVSEEVRQSLPKNKSYYVQVSDRVTEVLNAILLETLRIDRTNSQGDQIYATVEALKLETQSLPVTLKSKMELFLRHAESFLNNLPRLKLLSEAIIDEEVTKKLDEASHQYDNLILQKQKQGSILFGALVLLSIVMLCYILLNLYRLSKSAASLKLANDSLELKVQERTAELQSSHQTILAQQQALVSKTKMSTLGEMAGGIAHEINNPLTIIYMRAVELKDLAAEEDLSREIVQSLAEKIEMTSMRISKIVKGLKSFARESEQEPLKESSVDSLVEETLGLCQERFRSHGIELNVAKDHSTKTVYCRATQISQVLLNLLNNAHDAVEKAKTKKVTLHIHEKDNFLALEVADTGEGVPKEIQDKIFQPFFTTKEVGRGTGLGLSISKGIVDAHGGQLALQSSNEGAVFSVLLPLKIA